MGNHLSLPEGGFAVVYSTANQVGISNGTSFSSPIIAGMTASLGVAFNSTFVALVVSIFLMFFLHQLQLMQDLLVLDSHEYCNKNLLTKLR